MMRSALDVTSPPLVWDPSSAADLPALVNEVREGRCALFVGAGLSVAAGLPDWAGLMQRIVALTGKRNRPRATSTELRRLLRANRFAEVADQCRTILGRELFYEALRAELGRDVELPPVHRTIVETPYACVVTTNFDTLLEDAYARWGTHGLPKAPTSAELARLGTLLHDGGFFILKAHGSIDDDASMVFTAEDYRRIIHANPAFQSIFSALLLTRAVLFVGYSLSDPNFRLLLDSQLTTFGEEVPGRYAVMAGVGEAERDILWRTARIRVFSYEEGQHQRVGEFLDALRVASGEEAEAPARPRRGRKAPAAPADVQRETLGRPTPVESVVLGIDARGERIDLELYAGVPRGGRWLGSTRLPPWPDLRPALETVFGSWGWKLASISRVGALLAQGFPRELAERLDALSDDVCVELELTPEAATLPWEWLIVEGTPLCLRHPVVRRPIGISEAARGFPFVGRPLRALLVGDPNEGPQALPGARDEVVEIESILRRVSADNVVTTLLGADAHTRAVVREIESGDYDVVHFAGHAWYDERQAYLWLSDGAVFASELASILNRRPPALLVLNSHYTAYVPVGIRDDPRAGVASSSAEAVEIAGRQARGFARIAGRAGVGAYLGCVAPPSDPNAAEVAIDLYRRLATGIPVAQALHEARVTTCSMDDASALFYSLTGRPEITLAAPPT